MKSELAIKLSKLEGFREPKISLEQYMTPPELAADMLYSAHMQQDIQGKEVVDLGTGTGIFAVGAAMLGGEVTAVEKDRSALEIAEKNAGKTGVSEHISFQEKDVSQVEEEFHTVFMNPPFSVHSEEGVKFLNKALRSSEKMYSVIYGGRKNTVTEIIRNSEHEKIEWQDYTISLPSTYGFHTEETQEIEVGVLITSKKD